MQCPSSQKCSGQLEVKKYENHDIDECNKCHGVWLDQPELIGIINKRDEQFSLMQESNILSQAKAGLSAKAGQVLCPKCNAAMKSFNYDYSSGVAIENCPNEHGFWLDKGELEKIQIHAEHWEKEIKKRQANLSIKMSSIELEENRKEFLKEQSISESVYSLFESIKNKLL